jgi:hypothetical protein
MPAILFLVFWTLQKADGKVHKHNFILISNFIYKIRSTFIIIIIIIIIIIMALQPFCWALDAFWFLNRTHSR